MSVTQLSLPVIAGGMTGLRPPPSAYRRGHTIGFRMCGPKSSIRAELHKQKILRNQ